MLAIADLLKAVEDSMVEYVQVTERLETERKKQSAIIQQSKHRENLEADVSKSLVRSVCLWYLSAGGFERMFVWLLSAAQVGGVA